MEFKTCPLCGSSKIQKQEGPYDFMIKGQKITTPTISYWSCPNCGEAFFDREANRKIDAALLPQSKKRASRAHISQRA
jgi:YgiT-type zinc finger domain-containing protein